MARFTAYAFLAFLAFAFTFSTAIASPPSYTTHNAVEVPEGTHNKADRIVTVDVTSRDIPRQIHEEVPEGTLDDDDDAVTVNVTDRVSSDLSIHKEEPLDHADQNVNQISVDEIKVKPAAVAPHPSTKNKLPTSDRTIRGFFVGYATRRTRCYRFRSYIIRAYYRTYRGYNCYRKIYHFRNYICVRPVCRALITYYRY